MAGVGNGGDIRGSTRRGRSFLRRRLPAIIVTSLVFLLTLAGIAAEIGKAGYNHYDAQIHREPGVINTHDPKVRAPQKQLHAENFLVIGSDTRVGQHGFGNTPGGGSDTTMLVHLSPNRKNAVIVSIPRDSWNPIPSCTDSRGVTHPAHVGQMNSAYNEGGAACTVKMVQDLTGIAIQHFVAINFNGFRAIIDALGSVTVCSPTAVTLTEGVHLTLKAGNNKLNGAQALSYVRARHQLGDGSDLGRIKRQQRFLSAVLREARGGTLLSSPTKLNSLLNAATKALTVDEKTHIGDLKTLFDALRGLDPKHVTLYTAPIANAAYNPQDPRRPGGRVLLDDKKGRILYDNIINDSKVASTATRPGYASPIAASPTTLTVAPSEITVAVTNATNAVALAAKVQTALSGLGFHKGVLAKNPHNATGTVVKFSASEAAAARTVAAAFPDATMQLQASHIGPIEVVVGSNYHDVRTVAPGQAAPSWIKAPTSAVPTAVTGGINAADKTCTNTH